jgi:hypothetical protein
VPREYLGCVMELKGYKNLWNGNRERSQNNHCVGLQGLNLGLKIYAKEGPTFLAIRPRKRCVRVNLQVLQTSQLQFFLCVIEKNGLNPKVPKLKSRSGGE